MKDEAIVIAVIAGTSRDERRSLQAAKYVAEMGRRLEYVEIIFVDPKDFNLPGDGNNESDRDAHYTDIVTRADAYFIVTPEYNHSIPGSLKRMLDSEYGPYLHKQVALAGVSNGPWGGVRACEALLPICHRLGMVNLVPELYFPNIQDIFSENGAIREDLRDMYEKNVRKSYDELLWFARLLKSARS